MGFESMPGYPGANNNERPKVVKLDHLPGMNVPKYLDHYGVGFTVKDEPERSTYILKHCLFDSSHVGKDAVIFQDKKTGRTSYHCFHNSCKNYKWKDAKVKISGNDDLSRFWESKKVKGQLGLSTEFISFFDVCSKNIEIQSIAKGFIDKGDLTLFAGDGGVGKSMLSFYIALCLAEGVPALFDKFPIPEKRSSLFIQSENPQVQINHRLKNMIGDNPERIEASKMLYSPLIHDDLLTTGQNFKDKTFCQWVVDMVHRIEDHQGSKLDLLWLDPLISYVDCDENAAAEMRSNLDGITAVSQICKVTPIVIHHNKKDGSGFRGSSAIRDWARNQIQLKRTFIAENRLTDYNPDTGERTSRIAKIPCINVQHEKCNNFQMFEDFILRMTPNQRFKLVDAQLTPEQQERCGKVQQALKDMGGYAESSNGLVNVYMHLTGVSRGTARNHITESVDLGFIIRKSEIENGCQNYIFMMPE